MPERIPQGVALRVPLFAVLASDHMTAATGKTTTISIKISKNGATPFADPAAGATGTTEIASGWYYADLGTGDTDTLGPLVVKGSLAAIDDIFMVYDVVSANNAGLAALPDLNYIAKTGAAIPRGTVTSGSSTTSVTTSALAIAGSAATGVVADQFVGRVVLFDGATTTAGLRGASSAITGSTASNTPTITVDPALPATPASGDLFSIV